MRGNVSGVNGRHAPLGATNLFPSHHHLRSAFSLSPSRNRQNQSLSANLALSFHLFLASLVGAEGHGEADCAGCGLVEDW